MNKRRKRLEIGIAGDGAPGDPRIGKAAPCPESFLGELRSLAERQLGPTKVCRRSAMTLFSYLGVNPF